MKNVRVKVRYHTCLACLAEYDVAIFDGKECLFVQYGDRKWWKTKPASIRNAKAMAKHIGIPYDSEIVEQKDC